VTPDADSFRALARSSPWRWRTLHLRARSSGWTDAEAYVQRPDRLRTKVGDQLRVETFPYDAALRRQRPVLRPDGLVAERPEGWWMVDDPIWRDYYWVAMLDPEELSHDVAVDRLRAEELHGRRAWRADLTPLPGYEARCGGGCCELLFSEVSWHSDGNKRPVPPGTVFASHYDVALDVESGIVVRSLPMGAQTPWLEVEVLAVDGPAPDWGRVEA
jgi:hypothetical protein